jgi:hypothetical protein
MRLPKKFKPLFWWCKFSSLNPEKHKKSIIVQTINRGDWWHWRWIVKYYGKGKMRKYKKTDEERIIKIYQELVKDKKYSLLGP